MVATYTDYPNYPSLDVSFNIQLGKCIIRTFKHPEVVNMTYPILGGVKYQKVTYTRFNYTPNCSDFEMSWNSTFENGTVLPSWIEFFPTIATFDWYTLELEDDVYLNDSYVISLETEIHDTYYDPPSLEFSESFIWYLDFSLFRYIPPNTLPMFNSTLESRLVILGNRLEFSTGRPSEDTVKVDIEVEPEWF